MIAKKRPEGFVTSCGGIQPISIPDDIKKMIDAEKRNELKPEPDCGGIEDPFKWPDAKKK